MRQTLLGLVGAGVLVLAGAQSGAAGGVNCGIVNKDLQMGRTPQDISERMMISLEDIKKCQEEGAKGGAAAPAAGTKVEEKKAGGGAGGDAHQGH